MTRLQLWLVYGFTVFMLAIGLEIINSSIYQGNNATLYHFSPFDITYVIYVVFTLLMVRFLLKKFYPKKQYLRAIVAILCMFPIFIIVRYSLEELLAPIVIHRSNYNDDITIQYYISDNISYALYYILIGVLLFMLDYNILHQKHLHQLEAKNKEAELNFLKAQFNPHFLFNSLNNIYTLVSEKSENAAEAVMRLSDMTRYLIYEKAELCSLKDEVVQVENYIQLQQLRFEYPLPIIKNISGNIEEAKIPPYTLVTLIENAFKHGDFKNPEIPLSIHISAQLDMVHIIVSNKIGTHNKDATSGVGLTNIKKRLELIFPGQFKLVSHIENHIFTINLTIRY